MKHGNSIYEEILLLMNAFPTGLIVTGHSLGGATATAFIASFALDHADLFESRKVSKGCFGIHCISFGSPRVFDYDSTMKIEELRKTGSKTGGPLYRNLRFANDKDVITAMPPASYSMYYHAGDGFFTKENESDWYKLHDDKYRNFAFDVVDGMFNEIDDFIAEKAECHRLVTSSGYVSKFLNNELFMKAVEEIKEEEVKHGFMKVKQRMEEQLQRFKDQKAQDER